jgi:hypothetical protein
MLLGLGGKRTKQATPLRIAILQTKQTIALHIAILQANQAPDCATYSAHLQYAPNVRYKQIRAILKNEVLVLDIPDNLDRLRVRRVQSFDADQLDTLQ